jgi:hypothetical protein
VDDFHGMSPACKRIRQSLYENAVSAKIVGRIERRDHAKAKRAVHGVDTYFFSRGYP